MEDGTAWVLINVYGPVQDDRKVIFLQELLDRIKRTQLPLIVRWDFNLIRKLEDKSSGNVDHRFMDAFNDMVAEAELRELRRGGSRYTWTNKQVNPVQSVLDRVFVNNSWEDLFPLVRFEPAWLLQEDFTPWGGGQVAKEIQTELLRSLACTFYKIQKSDEGMGSKF